MFHFICVLRKLFQVILSLGVSIKQNKIYAMFHCQFGFMDVCMFLYNIVQMDKYKFCFVFTYFSHPILNPIWYTCMLIHQTKMRICFTYYSLNAFIYIDVDA